MRLALVLPAALALTAALSAPRPVQAQSTSDYTGPRGAAVPANTGNVTPVLPPVAVESEALP